MPMGCCPMTTSFCTGESADTVIVTVSPGRTMRPEAGERIRSGLCCAELRTVMRPEIRTNVAAAKQSNLFFFILTPSGLLVFFRPNSTGLRLTSRLVKVSACRCFIQQSNHLAGNIGRGVEHRGAVEVQSLQPRCVND